MSPSGYGTRWTLILHSLARRQRCWESLLTLNIFKFLRVTEHKQKLTSSQLSRLKKKGPLGSTYQSGINTGLWVTGARGWRQCHTASRWKPIEVTLRNSWAWTWLRWLSKGPRTFGQEAFTNIQWSWRAVLSRLVPVKSISILLGWSWLLW